MSYLIIEVTTGKEILSLKIPKRRTVTTRSSGIEKIILTESILKSKRKDMDAENGGH